MEGCINITSSKDPKPITAIRLSANINYTVSPHGAYVRDLSTHRSRAKHLGTASATSFISTNRLHDSITHTTDPHYNHTAGIQSVYHYLGIDFSKAFRPSELFEKYAKLHIPDFVYKWLVNFNQEHAHSTKFGNAVSVFLPIQASVIQWSTAGPASYIVTSYDLRPHTAGNKMDNTYLVVSVSNSRSCADEITNIKNWAQMNYLNLNRTKSAEIVFVAPRIQRAICDPISYSFTGRRDEGAWSDFLHNMMIINSWLHVCSYYLHYALSEVMVCQRAGPRMSQGWRLHGGITLHHMIKSNSKLYLDTLWNLNFSQSQHQRSRRFARRLKNSHSFGKIISKPRHLLHPLMPPGISHSINSGSCSPIHTTNPNYLFHKQQYICQDII